MQKESTRVLIKATVVKRCSNVIYRLRDNKSGLQTKTEVNASTIKRKKTKQQKH